MSLRVSGSISVLTLPLARMGQERGSNAEDPPHAHAKCRLRHVGARCIVRLLPGGSNAEPPPVRSRAALLDRVGRGGPVPRAPPTRTQNADCGTWACMTLLPRLPWARRWAASVNLAVGADGPGEGVQCRGPPPRARKMPIAARGRTMHRASPSGGQQCRATPRALSRGPPRPSRERGPNAEGPSHARAKCRLRHVGMHDSPSPICHWRCASCSARLLYLQYQFQLHA